jgi:anti-anti-sigma regulatory factor
MNRDLTLTTAGAPATNGNGVSDVSQRWLYAAPPVPPVWRHTLILTGSLSTGSAPELQEEIECLYQEGVTSLVLDLRRLEVIELGAVQAVASLTGLYKRRGISVAAIGGCPSVHHALMEAEAVNERIGRGRFGRPVDDAFRARSTEMIKQM